MHWEDLIHQGKGNRKFLQKEVKVYNAFTPLKAINEYVGGGDCMCITYLGFSKALAPQELSKR